MRASKRTLARTWQVLIKHNFSTLQNITARRLLEWINNREAFTRYSVSLLHRARTKERSCLKRIVERGKEKNYKRKNNEELKTKGEERRKEDFSAKILCKWITNVSERFPYIEFELLIRMLNRHLYISWQTAEQVTAICACFCAVRGRGRFLMIILNYLSYICRGRLSDTGRSVRKRQKISLLARGRNV